MLKALWSTRPKQVRIAPQTRNISIASFEVLWRRSARRTRSLALKLDKVGQLVVMTPLNTPEREVRRFVIAKQDWVHKQMARHQALEAEKERARGETLWFMGEPLKIHTRIGPRNQVERSANDLWVSARQIPDQDRLETRLNKWLSAQAGEILPQRLEALSTQTGLHGNGLQIKSYRARWGSCRHDGLIQLNWKLIMTPSEVIDYVIIHELSHLANFNHSAAFWAQVAQLCPDYKIQRQWLKQNGRLLITRG